MEAAAHEHHAQWLRGLCGNTGAPLSVFRRLLATEPLYADAKFLEWRVLDHDFVAVVLAHPNKTVRMALASNTAMQPAELVGLLDDPDADVRTRFLFVTTGGGVEVARGHLPPDVLARAADDPDPRVRRCVASAQAHELTRTPGISGYERHMAELRRETAWVPAPEPTTAAERARHSSWEVRVAYALSEGLSDEERSAVPDTVQAQPVPVPQWIADSYDDADAMRRIASSAFVLMRRCAAAAPRLPADVVALLAADDDFYVRLTLAQRCRDAPADLMLDMYLDWSGLTREFLRYAPGFPWYDSELLVSHAHERVRYIALEGPHISADQVARLAEDQAPEVRAAAVRHELFPGERAAALIDVLPHDAARNPNLPHDLMHRLLDAAGVPPDRS